MRYTAQGGEVITGEFRATIEIAKEVSEAMDFEPIKLAEMIEASGTHASLITLLEEVQAEYRYLSREAMILVSEWLGVPLSQVYSVATFYNAFTLKPRGKHLITVCLGTACHVRGSGRILQQVSKMLNVKPGETTSDGQYTLETVNCLGACALGPIMVIDGDYSGQMRPAKVKPTLMAHTNGGEQGAEE